MLFGNCYTYALKRYRKNGGWIVLRRSTKAACVIHAQWGASGIERDAQEIELWVGLKKIIGPDRGYLCWSAGRCVWRDRIGELAIEEYVPPAWADWLLERCWLARLLPLHAILFFGSVRKGKGETPASAEIINRTWQGRRDP